MKCMIELTIFSIDEILRMKWSSNCISLTCSIVYWENPESQMTQKRHAIQYFSRFIAKYVIKRTCFYPSI